MANITRKRRKYRKKDIVNSEVRKKLGMSQAQLAAMFRVTRAYIGMAESGTRNLHSSNNVLLINMYLQFHELDTGKQASYRSLETRLFLNDEYKKILPGMEAMEKDCRCKIKELKNEMEKMKEQARDAENAIIVFTTAINNLQGRREKSNKEDKQIAGLNLFKQQAYDKLLTCWEPEQAKLQRKIEAIAGEAKALRRYRIKVMKEHNPFKTIKKYKNRAQ